MRLEKLFWIFRFWMSFLFGIRRPCSTCGKRTQRIARFKVEGERHLCYIRGPKDERYCRSCLEAMCIKCAWCGEAITPGDAITLYSPRDKNYQAPKGAVVYSKDPLRLVGCLRWECADTGADRSGFWAPPGKVMRVASPIEEMMMRMKAGEEEPIVISNDLRDMGQATPVREVGKN